MSKELVGLFVVCPNCKRKDFVTTEKYDPNVTPNGSMVRCTLSYLIDWLTLSTTGVSEMTCPECLAQLAPSNRLTVKPREEEPKEEEPKEEEPKEEEPKEEEPKEEEPKEEEPKEKGPLTAQQIKDKMKIRKG